MSFFDKLAKRLELDDFDKRDKTAFVVLGCAAILILVLWFVQLNKNITNPLYGGMDPKQIQAVLDQQSASSNINPGEADLKSKDTDSDGLSDWDELNIYKTSPYLADSDSDGINDFEEVKKGTDPNCPTGKDCSGAASESSSPTSQTNQSLFDVLDQTTVSGTVTPPATNSVSPSTSTQQNNSNNSLTAEEKAAFRQAVGANNDPATLRAFLLSIGADKTYVDSLSDADLKKVINEILK